MRLDHLFTSFYNLFSFQNRPKSVWLKSFLHSICVLFEMVFVCNPVCSPFSNLFAVRVARSISKIYMHLGIYILERSSSLGCPPHQTATHLDWLVPSATTKQHGPYSVEPSRSSGGLFHRVTTRLVIKRTLSGSIFTNRTFFNATILPVSRSRALYTLLYVP